MYIHAYIHTYIPTYIHRETEAERERERAREPQAYAKCTAPPPIGSPKYIILHTYKKDDIKNHFSTLVETLIDPFKDS